MDFFSYISQVGKSIFEWVYSTGGKDGVLFFLAGFVAAHIYQSMIGRMWKLAAILVILLIIGYFIFPQLGTQETDAAINTILTNNNTNIGGW